MTPPHDRLDRAGIAVAVACAVHCAVLPLSLSVLPLLGLSFLASDTAEWAALVVAMGVSSLALASGYARTHRRVGPLLVFAAGAAVLVGARLVLDGRLAFELTGILIGVTLVVAAHVLNIRLMRECHVCDHAHDTGSDTA